MKCFVFGCDSRNFSKRGVDGFAMYDSLLTFTLIEASSGRENLFKMRRMVMGLFVGSTTR